MNSDPVNGPDAILEGPKSEYYKTKYGLDDTQINELRGKFKKDKDFVQPTSEAQKEFALDILI